MPYKDVVKLTSRYSTILDIVCDWQNGPTLRYYEAVCYNRKLVTDYKKIVDLPFYNPDFMKIIERPEDIDIDWVKSDMEVEYNYDGSFSPLRLLERIEKEEDGS